MATGSLGGAVRQIGELQAHLPASASVLIGAVALAAAVLPGLSQLTRYVNTMAHEGAHAVMGSAMGSRVMGVTLRGNGEGRTSLKPSSGGGFILAGVVGYLGPSLFGLGAAKLIEVGHIVAVLWLTLALLAVLAVAVRRSGFGLSVVVLAGVLLYLMARYAPVGGQVALAYGIAWFLLLSGVQVVLAHGRHASDAIALRELTRLPRWLWAALWLAGSATALILGARMLV
ncbi:MAG TPA: M50 family metallopeptidase [Streptosporangiaceae bacterium]|nr:M50 family metallopeptidase [Streptosporangiaceae bacterium]